MKKQIIQLTSVFIGLFFIDYAYGFTLWQAFTISFIITVVMGGIYLTQNNPKMRRNVIFLLMILAFLGGLTIMLYGI